MKLLLSTLILIFLWPQAVLAIDCQKASLVWEKMVCHSKILMDLDFKLNLEYKESLKAANGFKMVKTEYDEWFDEDGLRQDQKNWLDNLKNCIESESQFIYSERLDSPASKVSDKVLIQKLKVINESSLKDMYVERLEWLQFHNGKSNFTYNTRKPEKNEIHSDINKVNYVWHLIKLNNKIIIEYPQLADNINKNTIRAINDAIEQSAKKYVYESLLYGQNVNASRRIGGINYENFSFKVTASNANIFGIEAYDKNDALDAFLYGRLWDLKTGKEFSIGDLLEIVPDKKAEFWNLTFSNYSKDDEGFSLKRLIEYSDKADLIITPDDTVIVSPCMEGLGKFGCDYYKEYVPLSKLKLLIRATPVFKMLHARLAEAGLISKNVNL